MTRPREKTTLYSLDDGRRILSLFGTVPNALSNLALTHHLSASDLRDALTGQPVRPGTTHMVERAWETWRRYFMTRNDVISFSLHELDNPDRRDTAPADETALKTWFHDLED